MPYTASINSKSKILHNDKCGFSKRILAKNKLKFDSHAVAYAKGYHLCKYCFKNDNLETCIDMLEEYDITYSYDDDFNIDIVTPDSEWKVVYYGMRPVLYHKNRCFSPNIASAIHGYHFQTNSMNSLKQIIKYIIHHDNYRKSHPIDYSHIVKGEVETKIDPYLMYHLKRPLKKSTRVEHLESYKKGFPNNRMPNRKTKKGQRKQRRIKRAANQIANQNNTERVALLLELIAQS